MMGTESRVLLCGGETPLEFCRSKGWPLLSAEPEEELGSAGLGGSFKGLMPSSGISSSPVI